MGHVTKDGEDGKARNKAGNTVDGTGQQGIPGRERGERLLVTIRVHLAPLTLCSQAAGRLWNLQSHPVSKATPPSHFPAVMSHGPQGLTTTELVPAGAVCQQRANQRLGDKSSSLLKQTLRGLLCLLAPCVVISERC